MTIKEKIYLKLAEFIEQINELREHYVFLRQKNTGKINVGLGTYGEPFYAWDNISKSKIHIGKFCSLAKGVQFDSGRNHNIKWVSTYPFRIMYNLEGKFKDGHPFTKGDTKVGNDVWIGEHAMIMSGLNIGHGAVIASYSLVTKDVEPYTVVGGNPAKVIKKRFSDEEINALLAISWWDWPIEKILEEVPYLNDENIGVFISRHINNN